MDYEDGAAFAYIRFKETEAATDACRAMKGFSFGGRHTILVDFAKFVILLHNERSGIRKGFHRESARQPRLVLHHPNVGPRRRLHSHRSSNKRKSLCHQYEHWKN